MGGPPPSAAWDTMADWYTANMSPATTSLALTLFRHLDVLDTEARKLRVLETHCGDARAAAEVLPTANCAEYAACDFSEGMLSVAASRLEGKASTVKADSAELPFDNASFDRYMSNLGACCAPDLGRKFKEARRVLAAGGRAAMSMRVGGVEGDTSFQLVASTLQPFGFPPQPEREGLLIGRDLPALRKRLQQAGFISAQAWRTWISIPIESSGDFVRWATTQPPIVKLLAGLSEEQQKAAMVALEAAGQQPARDGALQVAVAVAIAEV